jgi:hypothetical protein
MEAIEVYKCKVCSAPIEYTPDSIVIKCNYCGYYEYLNPGFQIFVLESLDKSKMEEIFWNRMKNDRQMKKHVDKISLEQMEGIYVPVYYCNYVAEYFFIGEKVVTKTVRDSRGNVRTITERIRVSDEGEKFGLKALPAKKHIEELGIKELCKQVENLVNSKESKLIKAEEFKWNFKGEILSFDFNPEEIKKVFEDIIAEEIKNEIKSKYGLSELKVLSCNVNIKEIIPVYAPIWIASYKFTDMIYSISFSGKTGSQLVAVEPMFRYQRIISVALSSIFAALLTFFISSLFIFNTFIFMSEEFTIIILIFIIILLGISIYFMNRAFKGERIER